MAERFNDGEFVNGLVDLVKIGVDAERERCAKIAEAWETPSFALMRAGEMTAQELRTAIAVAAAIARSIRSDVGREQQP